MNNSSSGEKKEICPDEDLKNDETEIKRNKKTTTKKKKVQVHVEKFGGNSQDINNIKSPKKISKQDSRKTSLENKNNQNTNNKEVANFEFENHQLRSDLNNIEIFNKNLKLKPLLILANKSDLSQIFSIEKLAKMLGLYFFKDIKWYIRATTANTGEGLSECLDWVIDNINIKKITFQSNTHKKTL